MKTTPLHRHPAMKRTLASALLALVAASALQADVPLFINYQGRVTDSTGAAIGAGTPVNRKVIFRIFAASTGGSTLYTEEQTVTIFNGEFSVLIGQGIAFPSGSPEAKPALDTVFGALSPSTTDRYLEILVDNGDNTINGTDQPITPRQQMTSVGYAMRAKVADSVAPGFDLNLNGSSNYGLGWYGTGRTFNTTAIDGPVLYGFAGGALGSYNGTTQATALRWNAAGQVGIGTVDPSAETNSKLVLQGDDSNAPPKQLTIRGNTSPTNKRLYVGYNTTGNYGALQAYNGSGLTAGAATNLVLNEIGGNVGIGTTAPKQRLHVNGDYYGRGHLWLHAAEGDGTNGTAYLQARDDSTTSNIDLRLRTKAGIGIVEAMTLTSLGNVGIGTTSPGERLTVVGSGTTSTSTALSVWNSAITPLFHVRNDGNVGVGTNTPASKLDVAGKASAFAVQARGSVTTHDQGNYMEWNLNGLGESNFVNQKGLGSGGWVWYEVNSGNTYTERMRMDGSGAMGIGASPNISRARLTVGNVFTSSGVNTPFPQGRYMDNTSTGAANSTWGGGTVSIEAQSNIVCNGVWATSDERIKKVGGHSDGAADLKTLLGIKITDYIFKDQIANGSQPQKKVIAQQVEKIFPQAVSQGTNTVPDIFKKAAIKDGWVSLTTDLKKGDRVKLMDEKDAEAIHEVLEVKKDKFRTAFKTEAKEVFVYGREVNDFRRVDYEAISMLNVSATQQIKKEKDAEVKALKDENADLKAKLAAQDTRLATLEAQTQRLADLEAKDKAREAKLAAIEKLLLAADKAAVKPVSLKKSAGGAE